MRVIFKTGMPCGKVTAPPSKSMAHRAVICAALSEQSRVNNIELSDDIKATISCLKALGASVCLEESSVTLGGLDVENIPDNAELFANESGSTLRFMIPLCLFGKRVKISGAKRLFERPLTVYTDEFDKAGIEYSTDQNSISLCGSFDRENIEIAGNISSQFISGFCFMYPMKRFDSSITVLSKFESKPYVDMTLQMLKNFGIKADIKDNVIRISGNQKYEPCEITVEGDCSNAAFLDAFNLLGGKVEVLGLDENTLQGDRVYKDMFAALKQGEREFNLADCPDLAPIMFAMAAEYGRVAFSGTKRLAIKESDRATAMAKELSKFGVKVEVYEDTVIVNGGKPHSPKEVLCGHNDHRIVMALSVLCSKYGGEISGSQAVNKSFPTFFEKLKSLGMEFEIYET